MPYLLGSAAFVGLLLLMLIVDIADAPIAVVVSLAAGIACAACVRLLQVGSATLNQASIAAGVAAVVEFGAMVLPGIDFWEPLLGHWTPDGPVMLPFLPHPSDFIDSRPIYGSGCASEAVLMIVLPIVSCVVLVTVFSFPKGAMIAASTFGAMVGLTFGMWATQEWWL